MKTAAWLCGLLVCLAFCGPANARELRLRSGEHESFSRLVLPNAGPGWQLQASEDGGFDLLTQEPDLRFQTSGVFEMIPKTRLRGLVDAGDGVLSMAVATGQQPVGYYHGDAYVIDISRAPQGAAAWNTPRPRPKPEQVRGDPGALTALVAQRPAISDARRMAGGISELSAMEVQETAPDEMSPVESELLFEVARAASEGTLQVSDPALLARRRQAVEPDESLPAAPAPEPGPAPLLDCQAATRALMFGTAPPRDRAEAEARYLSLDQERSAGRVAALARDFLSLGLSAEAWRLLDLSPAPDGEVALLQALAPAFAVQGASLPVADNPLVRLKECGPTLELWALAVQPQMAFRSAPYALFAEFMGLPPALRAALRDRFEAGLAGREDAAAGTLLALIAQTTGECAGEGACPSELSPPDLLSQVKLLASAGQDHFATGAAQLYEDLLGMDAAVPAALPHYIAAIAFERPQAVSGAYLRAAEILALGLSHQYGEALSRFDALPRADMTMGFAARAVQRVAEDLAKAAEDDMFLRVSFAHSEGLRACCLTAFEDDILPRLAGFGFSADDLHSPDSERLDAALHDVAQNRAAEPPAVAAEAGSPAALPQAAAHVDGAARPAGQARMELRDAQALLRETDALIGALRGDLAELEEGG